MGIHVVQDEVTRVDAAQKAVFVSGGGTYPYDKLYLATGSSSFVPPIEGRDLAGVMTLRGLPDAEKIKTWLAEKKPKHIVCIGAGFISMEIASLLAETNPDSFAITVVELMDRPLPLMLDKDMSDVVREYLEGKGLQIRTGVKVEKLTGQDGKVTGVTLSSGETLDADMVFMNVGVRPNTQLATDIGLEMGRFGIKVNAYQETSDPHILAGGDCVEKINFITGKPTPGQLRGPAVVQGRLAAKRLAGFDIAFPGVLDAGGCKMFDMTIAATGLTEENAIREGFTPVSAVVDSRSKHGMIPGMKPWKLKLVFDKNTRKLLGGQIVSQAIAPAREIDAVTACILGGKTMADLTTFTSACNPDISSEPSAEPITIAAEQALQKVRNG
ncbi:NADPH-dependent 2,4-dienoyl-CoA reductase/sulfur reductase-like enzyme [Desulfoprunum benzoelyticum]|uniref:NADPH-dependent 2,4-dienoyl-CoA reductase/sulfur reductase-like enzyme n=1 Tax=Desulfoprunum benzoelyticum TaxID=1506996 RepID=A0A840V1Z2_9BACT|nr:FAD-dependent oxidoreductase [Desulfoprunum benzoelyticum]MBB5347739.1 NADPH-dependent 2,4-dienoyl-CoA reductase/sulfur reductase-like enzyme [Desulfoprunum benzoelyticum]